MIWAVINLLLYSLILHEMGHFLFFRWVLHKDVEIRFSFKGFRIGYIQDYRDMTKAQKYELYLAGIFAGLIPIIVMAMLDMIYSFLLPIIFVVYLGACFADFKKIWRLVRS